MLLSICQLDGIRRTEVEWRGRHRNVHKFIGTGVFETVDVAFRKTHYVALGDWHRYVGMFSRAVSVGIQACSSGSGENARLDIVCRISSTSASKVGLPWVHAAGTRMPENIATTNQQRRSPTPLACSDDVQRREAAQPPFILQTNSPFPIAVAAAGGITEALHVRARLIVCLLTDLARSITSMH